METGIAPLVLTSTFPSEVRAVVPAVAVSAEVEKVMVLPPTVSVSPSVSAVVRAESEVVAVAPEARAVRPWTFR